MKRSTSGPKRYIYLKKKVATAGTIVIFIALAIHGQNKKVGVYGTGCNITRENHKKTPVV